MAELPENIRAFVAIHLPETLLATLVRVQEQLKAGLPEDKVRWTPPDQMHLTLKFLGRVSASEIPRLEASLAQLTQRFAPMRLRAEGFGCFPNRARP